MNLKVKETLDQFVEEINNNCKYYRIKDSFFNEDLNLTDYIRRLELYMHFYIVLNIQPKDIEGSVIPSELKSEIDFIDIISKKYSYFLLSKIEDREYLKKIIKVNYNPDTQEYVAEKSVKYFSPMSEKMKKYNEESRMHYLNELDIFDNEDLLNDIM